MDRSVNEGAAVRGLASSYTKLRSLGQGGMGEVFLVRAEPSGELRALKTLHPHLAEDERICAMVRDEARLVASIDHENVARLVDAGDHHGAPFFVMEHVDGTSFRELIREAEGRGRRVPLGVALRVCAEACAGLHAAHELRDVDGTPLEVVHRDMSPHNVLVSRHGDVKLIDFGVAKSRGRMAPETKSSSELKGKIRYMAPEQALAMKVDRRTDVFGLAAALYHAVVGEAPFDGPSVAVALGKITSMCPVPIPASVPEPVAAVLRCGLHPLADGRYPSALAFRDALLAAAQAIGEPATRADVARYVTMMTTPSDGRSSLPTMSPLATPFAMSPLSNPLVAAVASARPAPAGPTRGMKVAALAVGFVIAMSVGLGVQIAQRGSASSDAARAAAMAPR